MPEKTRQIMVAGLFSHESKQKLGLAYPTIIYNRLLAEKI